MEATTVKGDDAGSKPALGLALDTEEAGELVRTVEDDGDEE